jgi:hypothetical protein
MEADLPVLLASPFAGEATASSGPGWPASTACTAAARGCWTGSGGRGLLAPQRVRGRRSPHPMTARSSPGAEPALGHGGDYGLDLG